MPDTETEKLTVTNATELKDLVRMRGSIKGRLTIFATFLNTLKQNPGSVKEPHIKELTLRSERLDSLFSDYNRIQTQIEVLCASPDEQLKERELFESQFYSSMSEASLLIGSHASTQNREKTINESISSTNENAHVKLPIMKLPTHL